MKKIMYPLTIGLMSMVLAACGAQDQAKKEEPKKTEEQAKADQPSQKEQQKQMEEMQKKMEAQKVDEKKTVATVNGKAITGSDYNSVLSSTQMQMQQMGQDPTSKEAEKQVKDQTVNTLVGQNILMQEADKKGYKASADEVKKQIDEIKKQYNNDDKKFQEALKMQGMDEKQLNEQVAQSIKMNQYVSKEIPAPKVTDKEIEEYYNQFAQQGGQGGQKPPKLEEVKPQIQQQLTQQKQNEALGKKVEELKKTAKVEIKI
ncbi:MULTISPECIES: SurA N-terminal domain-containing protein [Bacillaceae]|uniref:peptidylprolyl isomerase n=1 Tax=Metabacillus sediminis TaxID=3117746 RepID=A0ABZ2NLA5_9BACI|nr:SurA N-terminal domain-containing protein [Bacillus sp. SJS]KZZ83170.1 peptidylprolyl isomerase [Bacillus sp. SJS]